MIDSREPPRDCIQLFICRAVCHPKYQVLGHSCHGRNLIQWVIHKKLSTSSQRRHYVCRSFVDVLWTQCVSNEHRMKSSFVQKLGQVRPERQFFVVVRFAPGMTPETSCQMTRSIHHKSIQNHLFLPLTLETVSYCFYTVQSLTLAPVPGVRAPLGLS